MLKGKQLREAVAEKLGLELDNVRLSKGRATVKTKYFYRSRSCDAWGESLQEKLGSEFKVEETQDHWNAWPKDSFFVAFIVSSS